MTRIGRRTRDEAIEACLLYAAMEHDDIHDLSLDPETSPAVDRTITAALEALPPIDMSDLFGIYLEVAALLADGWSPGDPVYLLSVDRRSDER